MDDRRDILAILVDALSMAHPTYVGNSKDIAKDWDLTRPPGVPDHAYPAQSIAIFDPPVPKDYPPYLRRELHM